MSLLRVILIGGLLICYLGVAFWHYRLHHGRLHGLAIFEYILAVIIGGTILLLI
jgi:hypothetical protein